MDYLYTLIAFAVLSFLVGVAYYTRDKERFDFSDNHSDSDSDEEEDRSTPGGYNYINGRCVKSSMGKYSDILGCSIAHSARTGWKCTPEGCVRRPDGEYPTETLCEVGCSSDPDHTYKMYNSDEGLRLGPRGPYGLHGVYRSGYHPQYYSDYWRPRRLVYDTYTGRYSTPRSAMSIRRLLRRLGRRQGRGGRT
jgi:hypothetical protein